MTTTVAEKPKATGVANVVKGERRTIALTEEYRCKRPTHVAKGGGADSVRKCGAEAFVKVTYPGDVERFYCAHHFVLEQDAVMAVATSVLDERAFINKAASASS